MKYSRTSDALRMLVGVHPITVIIIGRLRSYREVMWAVCRNVWRLMSWKKAEDLFADTRKTWG